MLSWTLFFNTNKKGTESSKFLTFFIKTPLFKRDDVRCYFPGLCGVSETTLWHSRQVSATTFPPVTQFTKDDDSAKTLPVLCCFWRICFWPFRSIATSSFDRIYPGSKHFVRSGFWPNYVSQCCVCFSLTLLKHLDYSSNFHKAVVTSRAFPSHFVSWF